MSNSKISNQQIQENKRLDKVQKKKDSFDVVRLHVFINQQKTGVLSGVGFEPTPTRVDCDLNAAP